MNFKANNFIHLLSSCNFAKFSISSTFGYCFGCSTFSFISSMLFSSGEGLSLFFLGRVNVPVFILEAACNRDTEIEKLLCEN